MPQFFVVESSAPVPIARVDVAQRVRGSPWMNGAIVPDPGAPVQYTVDPDSPGNLCPFYTELEVPAIRDDLLDCLRSAGVTNIQVFDAVILDEVNGIEHTNYKAINILGRVAAADLGKSQFMHDLSLTGVDRAFHRLALKEDIRTDLLLFRLAEASHAIVVHEKVKQLIEARKIEEMRFYATGEWSG